MSISTFTLNSYENTPAFAVLPKLDEKIAREVYDTFFNCGISSDARVGNPDTGSVDSQLNLKAGIKKSLEELTKNKSSCVICYFKFDKDYQYSLKTFEHSLYILQTKDNLLRNSRKTFVTKQTLKNITIFTINVYNRYESEVKFKSILEFICVDTFLSELDIKCLLTCQSTMIHKALHPEEVCKAKFIKVHNKK